jgi:hypothetical protein
MLNALWTLDGGILNWRAMARRPNPRALSFWISAARPSDARHRHRHDAAAVSPMFSPQVGLIVNHRSASAFDTRARQCL